MNQESIPFWSFSSEELLDKFNSDINGLSEKKSFSRYINFENLSRMSRKCYIEIIYEI